MAARKRPMTEEQRQALSDRMKAMNAAKANAPATQAHPRAIAAKTERRRRKGMGPKGRLNLTIPEHLEKDPNYRYYWLADRPGRVEQLTVHDDYDFVTDDETASDGRQTGVGTRIERHAGTDKWGNPVRHFLVRKPIEFHQADMAEKRAEREKTMAAIRRGKTPTRDGQPIHDDQSYTSEDRPIVIGHGDYKP